MGILKELKEFASHLSIMVVEDDKNLNEEIVTLAELFFKEVYFAYNGVEAFEIYVKKDVDIVLTDITMPKMDGVALSKKIRAQNPHQSIIVISAHRDSEYLVKLIDIGIQQLVYKPFDHQELLYRLLRVCEDITLEKEEQESQDMDVIGLIAQMKPQEFKKETISSHAITITEELAYDIEYLIELRDELEYLIEGIGEVQFSKKSIATISSIFSKMYTVLSQIASTQNISVVIYELANFIENINYEKLDDEQKKAFNMLEHINDDIATFINSVFVYQDVTDISYLEKSLQSSLAQLKQNIFDDFILDDSDIELF